MPQNNLVVVQRPATKVKAVKNPNGITPVSGLPSVKRSFNPAEAVDPAFQKWYSRNTLEGQAGIPYDDKQVYDYLSFYKNGEYKNPEYGIDKHFPDIYKRPSHPTFSNESIYSTPEKPGGSWGGSDGETYSPNGKFQYNLFHGGGELPVVQPKILQDFEAFRQSPEGKFQFENMERNRIAKKNSGRIDYSTIDPITDVALPIASIAGTVGGEFIKNAAKSIGSNIIENTALKNAYKINPWAFKINPEAYYRGVGKEGVDDILSSGIIRSKKELAYPRPYFVKGRDPGPYTKGYMAELTNEPMEGVGSFSTGDLIQTPVQQIRVSNPNLKLYKEDWLRGYKEMKKSFGGNLFANDGSIPSVSSFIPALNITGNSIMPPPPALKTIIKEELPIITPSTSVLPIKETPIRPSSRFIPETTERVETIRPNDSIQKKASLANIYAPRLQEIVENPKKIIEPISLIDPYVNKRRAELSGKKREDIIKDYGFDRDVSKMSLADTYRLQRKLEDSGYSLPQYGADGMWGKETENAYSKYKEDTIAKELSSQKKIQNAPADRLKNELCKSKFGEEGCAAYVSKVSGYTVGGDAWTMKDNIEKSGGKIKYNIYDDPRFKNAKDTKSLIKTTLQVKKDNKATADKFEIGDEVGLFYYPSTNHSIALREGKGTYNTHVGIVTDIKDGKPIISHNIHGKLHHDKFDTLNIGWVGGHGTHQDPGVYKDDFKSDDVRESIKHYAGKMADDLGVSIPKDQIEKDVYGITRVETNEGKLKPTSLDILKSKAFRFATGNPYNDANISKGAVKLKLNSLTPKERKFLNINDDNIDTNSVSVKAATYMYLKNYKQFEEYAKANPHLKLSPDDIRTMAITAHNQGSKKLLNVGYNSIKDTMSGEVEKLKGLREGKSTDISATKYKYLPIVGKALFNKEFPGGYDPYAKRVIKHGEKLTNL